MPKINRNRSERITKGIGENKHKLGNLEDHVVISLKYLDLYHSKFCIDNCEANYFLHILFRLKDISAIGMSELIANRSSSLKFNHLDFDDPDVTENSFGIPREEEIVSNPRELEITRNLYGRVHGFCIDNVFYIRWLDPNHNLCKSKRYKK